MVKYIREELAEALRVVSSTIIKCEKAQQKFAEGTSQHTLLKNRIKTLPPVSSIISKCEKAQIKFAEATPQHNRFKNIISAMYISKSLITDEIIRRG